MNAGNFPTISHARNQVGGSHYVIRQILQELEYKSKITSMNTRDGDVLEKKAVKVNKASTDVEAISGIQLRVDAIHKDTQIEAVSHVNVAGSGHKNVRAKEGPETLALFEKTMSQEVVKAKPVVSVGVNVDVFFFFLIHCMVMEHSNLTFRQGTT